MAYQGGQARLLDGVDGDGVVQELKFDSIEDCVDSFGTSLVLYQLTLAALSLLVGDRRKSPGGNLYDLSSLAGA